MIRLLLLVAALFSALPALPAAADAPGPAGRRSVSCAAEAFTPVIRHGVKTGYQHKRFHANADIEVGGAIMDWCLAAQNAAIYFYMDDPTKPQHIRCPQDMSVAVFPGQGANVRDIIESNKASYLNPAVKLIEQPVVKSVEVKTGDRTLATVQLQGVMVDSVGQNRRQTMIGYARGSDFVRVMTSVVDDPACSNAVTQAFMAKLAWP